MSVFVVNTTPANAATSNTLNFQGRLLTNTGGLVADGSYNIEFNLYTVSSGGTPEWTETRLNSNTQGVTVKNGYFSSYLGSVTAFPSNINWDQDHWLGMTIRGTGSCVFGACSPTDGEMTPRFKLTAVPYAFRAGAVTDSAGNAYTGDDLIQKSPSTIQAVNSALAAIRLNQAGAGSLLQLQGNGTDVFTVDKTGTTSASGTLSVLGSNISVGTTSQSGLLILNDGTTNTTSIQAGSTASNLTFTLPTGYGTNGDCLTGNGAGVLSFASTCGGTLSVNPTANVRKSIDETQNNVVNPTAALQNDDELLFAIGANETWSFRYVVTANANATPDIRFTITAPTGATCRFGVQDAEGATTVGNLGCAVSSGLVPGNTAEDVYEVTGTVVNAANAGNVRLQWAQNTANVANVIVRSGSYLTASRITGPGQTAQAFIQSGNSFGALATFGTNDNNALSILTNGVERQRILATGETRFGDDIIANGSATVTTGTTTGTGTNTTTLNLVADAFSVNDVVLIDNVGQDYYARITVDPGTGSYTVSPAVTFENTRTVTKYNVQNIGATTTDYTSQANRFFQGYFLGGVVVGSGSTTISDGSIESTTTLRIQSNGQDVAIGGGLAVTGVLSGDASGLTNINSSAVDGATISALNASNVSSGTLADARLSSNVTLLGNTFNGVSQLVQLNGSGNLPALNGSGLTNLSAGNLTGAISAIDGSALTNLSSGNLVGALPAISGASLTSLNGSNISSGTVADLRLSSNVTLLGNTFNGNSQLVQLTAGGALPALNGSGLTNLSSANLTGALPALNGSALTNLSSGNLVGALPAISGASLTTLNASNISSGTLADGRLSSNAALLTGIQTFSGAKTFGSGLTISSGNLSGGSADITTTGQITGTTIVGGGSGVTSLNATNLSSGTVADVRLSSNVVLLTGSQTISGSKTFSGGLVLGQSTVTSGATTARAVALPDEAGTICLSDTNTCGYLRIAAGSVQTDVSVNDVLAVNKTNATGNLITLQRSAAAVFTVANSGALQIQSTSTTALDIRNAGGTSFFSVDSSTGTVRVGPAAADGTGVLFVLDTKNTAGDPTGIAGAQYYNSSLNKFRCYENATWKDCVKSNNNVPLMPFFNTSAAATNLALNALNCVSDPNLRFMMNLGGQSKLRFTARIGGSIIAANTVRLQYHLGGDPNVATGDAGWTTLATSAGNHTLNAIFYSAESIIPAGAQTNNVLVRACLFSGNSTADPTLTGVTINTYD